jgi:hypothetical protein
MPTPLYVRVFEVSAHPDGEKFVPIHDNTFVCAVPFITTNQRATGSDLLSIPIRVHPKEAEANG